LVQRGDQGSQLGDLLRLSDALYLVVDPANGTSCLLEERLCR
jgi:hypothetical protein